MPKKYTSKEGDAHSLSREAIHAMRPMSELDAKLVQGFTEEKKKRGRPEGRNKTVVSISIDREVLELLRKSGRGWQSRVNALLRAATGLGI